MFQLLTFKRWQWLLMGGAVIISTFFLWFTNYLVAELSQKDIAEVKRIAAAFEALNKDLPDYTPYLRIIQSATIPLIEVDEKRNIVHIKNIDSSRVSDTSYLRRQLRVMEFYNNPIPIKLTKDRYHYVFYKEQRAITLLRYFPYVQLLLIFLFLGLSIFAFDASRRSEQNRVWLGLAKETAHQIGTPLSSLIAWVDYIRSGSQPNEEVLSEIEKDLQRLEVITERFSKIGSAPELLPYNVYDVVSETLEYLGKRISPKIHMSISDDSSRHALAQLNKNLFSWVIENLAKNAVDAMAGQGRIDLRITETRRHVLITVADTGKGIARADFKRIFEPGYTTKKRGWGLGLSLSRRIIRNYHNGEIGVLASELGKGTTFRIRLNK